MTNQTITDEWKIIEGYMGLRSMEEAQRFGYLSEQEQEELEHLAPRNPGFKFIDAHDAETLADPEATDFAEQFDGVTNAVCGESIHHSAKLLKHESYLVGAQARGVSRAVINAC